MGLKSFPISKKEYEGFWALQIKRRNDWWAVFSVNNREEVWPFFCYGVTPRKKRQHVPLDEYPLLRDIAGNFVHNVDEQGGRFFINESGVYFVKGENETNSKPEKFVEWKWDEHLPNRQVRVVPNDTSQGTQTTYAELMKIMRGR